MNNDPPSSDRDDVDDPIVSGAYRDIADEKVPAELDRAVLKVAAGAARPRYARSVLWLRPLAWAATIGLCLAIVLELSRVPQPDPAIFEVPAAKPESAGIKSLADEPESGRIAQPRRQDLDEFAVDEIAEDSSDKLELSAPASQPVPSETVQRFRSGEFGAAAEDTLGDSSANDFEAQNPELLRQAEDLARNRSEHLEETVQPELRSVSAASLGMRDHAEECDEDATATPAHWIECIEDLEKAGLQDAAQRERERLKSVFPEFELP